MEMIGIRADFTGSQEFWVETQNLNHTGYYTRDTQG